MAKNVVADRRHHRNKVKGNMAIGSLQGASRYRGSVLGTQDRIPWCESSLCSLLIALPKESCQRNCLAKGISLSVPLDFLGLLWG